MTLVVAEKNGLPESIFLLPMLDILSSDFYFDAL